MHTDSPPAFIDRWVLQLSDEDPLGVMEAAHVLGMAEETLAELAISGHANGHADHRVNQAMAWAARRIEAASARGHTTLEALWAHFKVDAEIMAYSRRQQDDTDVEAVNQAIAEARADVSSEIALQQVSRRWEVLAGVMMPTLMLAQRTQRRVNIDWTPMGGMLALLGERKTRRTPATAPSSMDIKLHVRHLLRDKAPESRRKAVITLGDLNNPAALGPLSFAAAKDPDDSVREAAMRTGQLMYWRQVYWELSASGALLSLMHQRAGVLCLVYDAQAAAGTQVDSDAIYQLFKAAQQKKRQTRRR